MIDSIKKVRRLSPCRLPDEVERVLRPVPDVVLKPEPVAAAEEDESPRPETALSPQTTKRRVGSFTLRSKKSENELVKVTHDVGLLRAECVNTVFAGDASLHFYQRQQQLQGGAFHRRHSHSWSQVESRSGRSGNR